jgi:hypothetical protein
MLRNRSGAPDRPLIRTIIVVALTDQRGIITDVNDNKFCKIAKYSGDELRRQENRIINSGHHSNEFSRGLAYGSRTGVSGAGAAQSGKDARSSG